ncbi:MAG: 4-alpha-glucanotransferase [Oscillospiraceae bacterium]|nr:4-alpha-glucanotransferase [Oscillospiraceae bacterium]
MEWKRSGGILLPISALPSRYGVGTLGAAAREFVDFLAAAGQRWWQVLPVGPTGYGGSPYQSFSTFAGNPYYIDLEELIQDGLLTRQEAEGPDWGEDPERVDYGKIYQNRFPLLKKAARRGLGRDGAALEEFRRANAAWLPDYALFMALKRHFDMAPWWQWPEEIRLRRPGACRRWTKELKEDVEFFQYLQILFFRQWDALRAYAAERQVGIIGDLPIYVALDSADVWAEPEWFLLDENHVPIEVAGVPPDAFNQAGQLWGNPLYRWDRLEADGFGWWLRRADGAFRLYDMVRLDHFRGFESFWAVPYGAPDARQGHWVRGPGSAFIQVLRAWFSEGGFIAEDLGYLTDPVRRLLEQSGFPGMKVLEFAFDPQEHSDYLPHRYPRRCVCYTGTHDNETLIQWLERSPPEVLACARRYLGLNEKESYAWGLLRGGMGSVADLFIAQMQDYLGLGAEGRFNTPGIPSGNWRWRMAPGALTGALAEKILELTRRYGR